MVGMYASHAIFIFFVCILGAPTALVTLDCGPVIPDVYEASFPGGRSVARERLLIHAVHAFDW
jgi:hypothetical protein